MPLEKPAIRDIIQTTMAHRRVKVTYSDGALDRVVAKLNAAWPSFSRVDTAHDFVTVAEDALRAEEQPCP